MTSIAEDPKRSGRGERVETIRPSLSVQTIYFHDSDREHARRLGSDLYDQLTRPADDPLAYGAGIPVLSGVSAENVELAAAEISVLVPVLGRTTFLTHRQQVVDELIDTMFSVRDWVFLGSLAVGVATAMTAALVFALSIRVRRREIETIRKIGGGRQRLAMILGAEILVVIAAAVAVAAVLTAVVSRFGELAVRLVGG